MSWKEQLQIIEKNDQWIDVLDLLGNMITNSPEAPEPYVQIIYAIHNLLLEEDYEAYGFNHDDLAASLLKYFHDSSSKFKDNSEYLFFIGIILHIAEWYFGQDDVQLALQMQKRAMELEPQNRLFRFSFNFSMAHEGVARELARELIGDAKIVSWLEDRAFAGQYVLGIIHSVNNGVV